MSESARSVRRARKQRPAGMAGFIVTWDVDSRDAALCAHVRRFGYGYDSPKNGKVYHYRGFVETDGVRYLGQSVLFVTADRLRVLRTFLGTLGVNHVVTTASLGTVLPN